MMPCVNYCVSNSHMPSFTIICTITYTCMYTLTQLTLCIQLASKCDILVENYVPGKLDKFGLGYEDLRSINKDLIYCSITGFGSTGPYSNRGGYDVIASGFGGLMHITGPKVCTDYTFIPFSDLCLRVLPSPLYVCKYNLPN